MHSDPSFALAVGVQQGALHVQHWIRSHVLLHVNLYGKCLILMTVGHHQQILPTNEEMPIELGDLPATRHPHAHHSFPTHVAGEHVDELRLELLKASVDVELRIVMDVTSVNFASGQMDAKSM
eukprot:Skav214144  [mRNA]  locus=scaffold1645:179229:181457:+ [translate_table: standard]